MKPVLLTAEAELSGLGHSEVVANVKKRQEVSKKPDGQMGLNLWYRADRPRNFLITEMFTSEKAAEANLIEFSAQSDGLAAAAHLPASPFDIRLITIEKTSGLLPFETGQGSYASLSRRIAEPGQAQELYSDLDIVFAELSPIVGLRGWLYGSDVSLSEQVIGMAFWDDPDSYRSSLPVRVSYELNLFKKLL